MFQNVQNIDTDYKKEYFRKAIHLCSLSIPVFYYFLSKSTTLSILIPITLIFVISDITRYYSKTAANFYYNFFGWLLRNHERDEKAKRLNGASNILIAAVVCVVIFPKIITITAFAVLIISDISAALIGRRFGKTKLFNKSLEGTIAFFISGFIVILLTPKINYYFPEYIIASLAVAIAAIIEASPIRVDDNISVPLSIGAIMWIGYYLLLPNLHLYILD